MVTSITLTCLTPLDNASLMPSSGPLRTISLEVHADLVHPGADCENEEFDIDTVVRDTLRRTH
eukprot:4376072-Prymnesium_polylepis.1